MGTHTPWAQRRAIPLSAEATYADLRAQFAWRVPERFNIGTACADEQAASTLALVEYRGNEVREHTFGSLSEQSSKLANALRGLGVARGDRVGIVLPQCLETGLAHLAVAKLGAVAVPLSGLFGPDALTYRLGDCEARAVLTDGRALDAVAEAAAAVGAEIIVVDGPATPPHHALADLLPRASARFRAVDTGPADPALLLYTSGTTGPPKGALHGHRVLLGHLPGYELMFEHFPQAGDRVWTPADWAWIGGLMDALLPAWYHGVPVVAATRPGPFDPDWAADVMADARVRVAFLPPTALKLMRQADADTSELGLRAVMSGGEPLGAQVLDWGRERLGVTINEIYGQTEANIVVGNCAGSWDVRPRSMGLPYPGHDVVALDDRDRPCGPDEVGELAVAAPDPVMFLGYWNQPEATAAKYTRDGAWLRTGDLGSADTDGYLWFASRADDVIISAGYRIGPSEIEDCLLTHPAVAMAAVVGVPDETRGQVVKAFVKPAAGHTPSPATERDIAEHVKHRLAAYQYPRQIEFVDTLPLTTTGKIRRSELRRREQTRPATPG